MAETLHTDQPTFSNATFLSTNVDLNYSAPTGFYSKEGRVRQWVNTGQATGYFSTATITDCVVRPIVEMFANGVTNVGYQNFKLTANVKSDGGGQVTHKGFVLIPASENEIPNILSDNSQMIKIEAGSGTGSFSIDTSTILKSSTEYYIRAYAYGEAYSSASASDKHLTVGYSSNIIKSTLTARQINLGFNQDVDLACG